MLPGSAMGHLELKVIETLWAFGEGNVREVVDRLGLPLAYNTVMTTLDRLYKKGLLDRRKHERAYIYKPRLSRLEWQQKNAESLVAQFLAGSGATSGLLISSLVDAVEQHDAALLDELEARIRIRRGE